MRRVSYLTLGLGLSGSSPTLTQDPTDLREVVRLSGDLGVTAQFTSTSFLDLLEEAKLVPI